MVSQASQFSTGNSLLGSQHVLREAPKQEIVVQNFERIALLERIKTLRSTITDCKNVKSQLRKVKQYLDEGGQPEAVQGQFTDLILRVKKLTESANLFPNGCNQSLSHLVALDFSDPRLREHQ